MSCLNLTKDSFDRVAIERRAADGSLEGTCSYTFKQEDHFRKAARALSVDRDNILKWVDTFRQGGPAAVQLTAPQKVNTFYTRGRLATETTAIEHADLAAALAASLDVQEPLIYWGDRSATCALDVDLHHTPYADRPTPEALLIQAERVRPRPSWVWSTHGRGLRLIYERGELAADELAAVGALSVAILDPLARCELKTVTRHPAYALPDGRACGPVLKWTPDGDAGPVKRWLGAREAEDGQVQAWLEARGLEIGRRYEHGECPVRPNEHANRTPVNVREAGVYCHACAGRGVTFGHRTPGWFPFAALVGSVCDSTLAKCLRGLCHWEHARFVVRETVGLEGDVARLAYSAALKLLHGDGPHVKAAMRAGANMVRLDGRWATLTGEGYAKDIRPILATLPAAGGMLDAVARLDQPTDLTELGYPALTPIWGLRVYSHRLPLRDPAVLPVVLYPRELAHESSAHARPRYRLPEHREYGEDEAWEVLETVFPGLNRNAVKLLIAAKGCAEGEVGLPPLLFFSGPTSSAKTSSVMVAAAVCGDSNRSVVWTPNVDRVRAALRDAKDTGSFVTFNEVLKEGNYAGAGSIQTMDFILNLTPDSVSHKMYVGPVRLGALPVCVWTDTAVPLDVKQSAQLARRLVHVRLTEVDWRGTLKDSGVVQIRNLRTADPRYASAADTVLSVVIDQFFDRPRDFEEIARELGFGTLATSAEAEDGLDVLRRFFRAVCDAPAAGGADARRWAGRGWKLIEKHHETDLSDLWQQLADDSGMDSRRCSEAPWATLLGVSPLTVFEARAHGGKVAVRFIARESRLSYRVNGELVGGPADLQPSEPVAVRVGSDDIYSIVEGLE